MPLRIKIQCSRISRECQEDQELDCRDMKCFECRERKWFWKHAQGVLTSIEYEVRSAAVVSLHHGQNIISCDVPCVQQHHNGPLPCTVAAQKPQKVLKRLWSAQLWGVKKKKKGSYRETVDLWYNPMSDARETVASCRVSLQGSVSALHQSHWSLYFYLAASRRLTFVSHFHTTQYYWWCFICHP